MEDKIIEVMMKRRDDAEMKRLCDTVRQTAYQIHLYFGTGYLEKVYENSLKHRLEKIGLKVAQQVKMVVNDEDGFCVGHYEADLVVDDSLILELKAIKALNAAHEAQLINYLKTTGVHDGMLINFGSEKFEVAKRICSSSIVTPKYIIEEPLRPFVNFVNFASAAAGKSVSAGKQEEEK